MRVADALHYANSFGHEFTEAEVRAEVVLNPKKRFQLRDNLTNGEPDPLIRAAQGHSMKGVGEEASIGDELTIEQAPEVAVHGTFVRHIDAVTPLSQRLEPWASQVKSGQVK